MEYFPTAHHSGTAPRDGQHAESNQKNSKIGSSSCRCTMTSIGQKVKTFPMNVFSNSLKVREYARRFQKGRWSFLSLGGEEQWYGTYVYKPQGKWNSSADVMQLNFVESGHPVFRSIQCLGQRILEKERWKHFDSLQRLHVSNAERSFRTINSVNWLSRQSRIGVKN